MSEKDGGLSHKKSQTCMSNNSVIVKIPTFKDTMVNHYFLFSNFPPTSSPGLFLQKMGKALGTRLTSLEIPTIHKNNNKFNPPLFYPKDSTKLFTILVHK